MKQIRFVIIFAAITGGIAFADGMDFTGEWVVESDDVGESGIAVTLAEGAYPRETPIVEVRGFGPPPPGWGGPPPKRSEVAFTVIPAGTFFDFAANGSKLTGTIVRNTEEPILNGKISGNKITFTVRETINGNDYSYSYAGRLSDDSIQFDVKPPANGGEPFKFTVRRAIP